MEKLKASKNMNRNIIINKKIIRREEINNTKKNFY